MEPQLPQSVIAERVDRLMTVQQQVAFAIADAQVGRTFDVLVDGPPVDGLQPARHAGQAPEVEP